MLKSSLRVPPAIVIALALLAISCSEPQLTSATSPTTTDTTTTGTTSTAESKDIRFSGQLDAGAARFYSFTVTATGVTNITLETLTPVGTAAASPPTVTLGLGVPSGAGCALTMSMTTGAMSDPLFSLQLATGTYCAQIADPGTLTAPVLFDLHIVLP